MLDRVCKEEGIEFMASVFDVKRIRWLEDLNVKRYKIASRSIHEEHLINAVIETGKPVLISLGMWKQESFLILGIFPTYIVFLNILLPLRN